MTNSEFLAATFKALAHPRRADIFHYLTEMDGQKASYAQLQSLTGLADTTLIHHLREMERGALIRRRRHGVTAVYSLCPGSFLRGSTLARTMILREAEPTAA